MNFEDDGASFRVRRARQLSPAPEIDSDPYDRIFGKSTRRLIRWAIISVPVMAIVFFLIIVATRPPLD